jgi:2-aminoadipate transaminase
MPEGVSWTKPSGGMAVWMTLPGHLDAGELLFRARERGVLFAPGKLFYFQNAEPNTLRLSFAALQEDQIRRGIAVLGGLLRAELRQRKRGRALGRRETSVALV